MKAKNGIIKDGCIIFYGGYGFSQEELQVVQKTLEREFNHNLSTGILGKTL